jgi:Domain of unknown function (DUF4166)
MRRNLRLVRQTPLMQTPQRGDVSTPAECADPRFQALLGPQDWNLLPAAVRRRFSKRLAGGATAIYVGMIDSMNISLPGRMLAQLLRLVGAPLPLHQDINVPSIVSVTEDVATGGQIWTRLYARCGGFPQIIQSSKRFTGPTGLEEYIGCGITMALAPKATATALIFESAGYSFRLGQLRLAIPRWLTPGRVTVTHEEVTPEMFRFTLELRHAFFGVLLQQSGLFHEEKP